MADRVVQLYSGVDSVRAADALMKGIQDRRDQWPYPHVYPPPDSKDVFVIGTATVDVAATVTVVVTYQVSSGKRFYLKALIFGYVGGSFSPGDALFTIDRNKSATGSNSQYNPEHGLVNVPVLLGNLQTSTPWPVQRAREFEPLDVVRGKAVNVNLSSGVGNTFVMGLFGWEVPVLSVPKGK